MKKPSGVVRAIVLASLAALVLFTHVFVALDRVRVKVVQSPTPATSGIVRATTAGLREANALRPPFALIARINYISAGTGTFSVSADGAAVCERSVAGGSPRRIDCAIAGAWDPGTNHALEIRGPLSGWTLEYMELATHHGNTTGAHYLVVLPASSDNYVRPGAGWVIVVWLMVFAAVLLSPAPPPVPRWMRLLYGGLIGLIVLELALSQTSQWISDYRIVLSAGTFARLLILLFVPRLWGAARALAHTAGSSLNLQPADRRRAWLALAIVLFCAIGVSAWMFFLRGPWEQFQFNRRADQARATLYAELQPIRLMNCEFQRFGEPNDGGYVLCANLLGSVQSAYSYGISGYDQWGCDITHRLSVPVHQYDCFNLQRPACTGGRTVFHEECVAGERATIDGRPFDTPVNQFAKNGDGAHRLVVKMDVEGAEWDTWLQSPDAVFEQIDQLTIELHGVQEPDRFTAVVKKLKRFFYVANLHYNNYACMEGVAPFPASVYEVLFVSKRIGVPGGSGRAGAPAALMAPNTTQWRDCQTLVQDGR